MSPKLSALSPHFLADSPLAPSPARRLDQLRPGGAGRILAVRGQDDTVSQDLERSLLEMGFVEGARIEVLHQGWLRRDPLAVRINQTMTVALRRSEANAVLVGPLGDQAPEAAPTVRRVGEPALS